VLLSLSFYLVFSFVLLFRTSLESGVSNVQPMGDMCFVAFLCNHSHDLGIFHWENGRKFVLMRNIFINVCDYVFLGTMWTCW
jgi:hypothetical protein